MAIIQINLRVQVSVFHIVCTMSVVDLHNLERTHKQLQFPREMQTASCLAVTAEYPVLCNFVFFCEIHLSDIDYCKTE